MRAIQKQIIYINKKESETLMKVIKLVEDIEKIITDSKAKDDLIKCHTHLCNVWNLVEIELE